MKINYSIIIPVKEINDYIKESIPIILNMDYENYEIIILPNEKPSNIPDYLKDKKIRIIPSGKVSPAIKRDMGAKEAKGKYLAFIDDDAYPEKNWLKTADSIFKEEKVEIIGGPAITPKNNTLFQKASGLFFETLFGGGGMDYRYKPVKKSFCVDDYPTVNLITSKKVFFDVNGFDNEFWPGEDTKFCLDLTKKGYKIIYSPKLIVYHHRRKSIISHLKQVGNYGQHRGYFAKKFPETSLRLTYFIPSLFLLGNLALLILSFFSPLILKLYLILLAIYFVLVTIDVFVRTKNLIIGLLTIFTVFLTHLFYGLMFIKGILSKNFRNKLR